MLALPLTVGLAYLLYFSLIGRVVVPGIGGARDSPFRDYGQKILRSGKYLHAYVGVALLAAILLIVDHDSRGKSTSVASQAGHFAVLIQTIILIFWIRKFFRQLEGGLALDLHLAGTRTQDVAAPCFWALLGVMAAVDVLITPLSLWNMQSWDPLYAVPLVFTMETATSFALLSVLFYVNVRRWGLLRSALTMVFAFIATSLASGLFVALNIAWTNRTGQAFIPEIAGVAGGTIGVVVVGWIYWRKFQAAKPVAILD